MEYREELRSDSDVYGAVRSDGALRHHACAYFAGPVGRQRGESKKHQPDAGSPVPRRGDDPVHQRGQPVPDLYILPGADHQRTQFIAICLAGILSSGSKLRETVAVQTGEGDGEGRFVLSAILLLGVIMCIYVGFENGFAFFVDTLFTDVLRSSAGKFALSLFWAVMIPSRILVGRFNRYAPKILIASILMIPATILVLSASSNPVAVLLLCIPLGFASGAIYPSVLTIMLPYAGKNTATATGIITAATGIGGVVFTAITGFLADRFGLQTAMLILVSFFIISLLSAVRVIRYRKQ